MLHGSETFEINEISFDKYALEEALELPVIHGANKKVRISSNMNRSMFITYIILLIC